MTCNVGGIERPIRILVGIGLLGVGALSGLPMEATAASLVLGTIALVTGAVGFCPLWKIFGINTCPTGTARNP